MRLRYRPPHFRWIVLLMSTLVALAVISPSPPALAAAPANAPTLLSPVGTTESANPVLTWSAVAGAAKYRVQISTDSSFASVVYSKDTVALRATPETDLPLGTLYWRVAATDGSTGVGPLSATASFTKAWGASPALDSPSDGETLNFPASPAIFRWNPLPGAKTYTLQLDDAPDFVGAQEFSTPNTSFTLTEPQTVGQSFYWRVRGTSGTTGVVSDWSETRSYTYAWTSAPTLRTPANTTSAAVTDVVFSWDPVSGAKTYELQVSPNGDWANNITLDVSAKGTRYSPPTTLDNGSYFWRVRAKDAKTTPNNGGWSDAWQFTRGWADRPTQLTPSWDPGTPSSIPHVAGPPTFTWTPVPHASRYELQVSTDINFSTFTGCYTNHTTFTPYVRTYPTVTDGGEPTSCKLASMTWGTGSVYYWRVRGIDQPGNVLGLWSNTGNADTFRFLRDPAMPTYLSPADGAAVGAPSLAWGAVPNVEKYRVTILKANLSTVSGTPVTTYATSYTPTMTLNPADGPFYWYVQGVDADGVTSAIPAQSDWRSFTLVTPPSTTSLQPLTPADESSSIRMPTMTWQPYAGATYYVVHYAANGFELLPTLSGSAKLPFAGFTYAGVPLAPDTYTWWVEAFNANGSLAVGPTSTFTIASPGVVGSADYLTPSKCTPLITCAAERDTPTLSWNAVPGAGAYQVSIAYDSNFTNVLKTYTTAYTTLTPRESLVDNQAGQAFYWFVRPCVDAGLTRCGPGPDDNTANTNASAFQKRSQPVQLQDPDDGATVANQVTFDWNDYLDTNGALPHPVTQEANQYRIQVSTVADFATVLDTQVLDQTSYTPFDKTYPEGPLYWRVQAIDGSANPLTWSDTRQVNKASPQPGLTYPADNATVSGVPYFQWVPQDYAAQYTIEVYKNGDTQFSPANRVLTATTKFAAWAPTTGLAAGPYAWRVKRLDADGRDGAWSDGRTFMLQAAAPTLTGPASGSTATSGDMLFTWTAVPNAAQYRWELSTGATFATLTASQNTVMTAWAPTAAIPDGTFYWRVRVLDANGNILATSSPWLFAKDATRPSVTTKSPTTAASISGPFTVAFSESVKNVSAANFAMTVAGTATTVAGAVTPASATPTTTATFTPTAPLVPGQSYTVSLSGGITDVAGNPLTPMSWTVRTSTAVDNTSSALYEVWDRDTSPSASGGSYHASASAGSSAKFTFAGTAVTLVGARSASGGYADIYLDGVKQAAGVSFYNKATQWQYPVWSKSGLPNRTHMVEVRPLGTKPASSSGAWVYVDAFKVGTAVYQENNSAVRESFRRVATASASGGSYDVATHATSGDTGGRPYYTLTFRGTRVVVYGVKSATSGSAAFYVDNVLRATVSLHSTATMYRALLFNSPALTNSVHTLRVELVGSANGANSSVGIDNITIS